MRKLGPSFNAFSSPVVDPRTLGMVPCSSPNLAQFHLESCVGCPHRKGASVKPVRWKGKASNLILYEGSNGETVRIWIIDALGPSVARVEQSGNVNGLSYIESVECEFQQVGPDQVWFPKACVCERIGNGKLTEREVANLEVRSIGEPLAPSTFQLEGMGIAAGTPISVLDDPRGLLKREGTHLVPYFDDKSGPGVPKSAWLDIRQIAMASCLILLGVILSLGLLRHYYRKRAQRD